MVAQLGRSDGKCVSSGRAPPPEPTPTKPAERGKALFDAEDSTAKNKKKAKKASNKEQGKQQMAMNRPEEKADKKAQVSPAKN